MQNTNSIYVILRYTEDIIYKIIRLEKLLLQTVTVKGKKKKEEAKVS